MSTTREQQTLTVRIEADRAEAIRRGYGAEKYPRVTLDLSVMSEAERAQVAERLSSRRWEHFGTEDTLVRLSDPSHSLTLVVQEPTQTGVLEAIAADEARRKEREAKEASARKAAEAEADALVSVAVEIPVDIALPDPGREWSALANKYRLAETLKELGHDASLAACEILIEDPRLDPLRERIANRRKEHEAEERARREAAAKRKEEERRAYEREREEWIREYGSDRLRRLLEEKIEHDTVYRDERIAAERPGWRFASQALPGEGDDPRNAPTVALDLLDEARTSAPDARLVYWVVEVPGDEDTYDGEAGYTIRGYTCLARFLGRAIVYNVDEDGTPPVVIG